MIHAGESKQIAYEVGALHFSTEGSGLSPGIAYATGLFQEIAYPTATGRTRRQ